MAGDTHHRPRNRTLLITAAVFILSIVYLVYMRLDPIPLSMSSTTKPHDAADDTIDVEKSKHDKGGAKRTYPQVSILPSSLLPTNTSTPRRLMIIGDVHGHLKSLEALLRKAEFSTARGDTVVFAGDMVNKGPDSAGVVALAMRIGAFGVRGNHEDRVLRAWEYLEAKKRARGKGASSGNSSDDDEEEEEDEESVSDEHERGIIANIEDTAEKESRRAQDSGSEETSEGEDEEDSPQATTHEKKHKKDKKKKGKKKNKNKNKKPKGHKHKPHHIDLVTAKALKPEHRDWLSRLPLILRIGDLGPRYGEVLVVHAGLVPGIPLESQDPEAVMTMRTILLPSSYDTSDHIPINPSHSESSQAALTTTADHGNGEEEEEEVAATNKGRKHHKHPGKMIPSSSRKGVPWAEVWTSYQQTSFSPLPPSTFALGRIPISPATVVYGHDAKAGLQMREYAFGIDSGCGNGDTLTGVVFEFGEQGDHRYSETAGEEADDEEKRVSGNEKDEESSQDSRGRRRARIQHRLVSVSCAGKH